MKNRLKAVGSAMIYFLLYFCVQIGFSIFYCVVVAAALFQRTPLALWQSNWQQATQILLDGLTQRVYADQGLILLGSGIATIAAFWLFFIIRKKRFFREIQAVSFRFAGICPLILLGLSSNIVISVLLALIPFPERWLQSYEESSSLLVGGGSLLIFLYTVFAAPIVEEITFRGLIYTRLKRGMPRLAAAGITSLVFAVLHGTIVWGIYSFLIGLLLIWLFERFQSLWANIIFHMAFNAGGMLLSYVNITSELLAGLVILAALVFTVVSILWVLRLTRQEKPICCADDVDSHNIRC